MRVCVGPETLFAKWTVKNANPHSAVGRSRAWGSFLAGVVLFLVVGSWGGATDAVKPASEYFPIQVGDKVVRMQLAVNSHEMERGLMFRKSMKSDEGMLFVYGRPQGLGFWMRNTSLPLDIGFFDADGRLREVYPLYPFDETTVKSKSESLQFALEVNQGWFRSNRVTPGARIDFKALQQALAARGFDPAKFGLRP
ncbi:MAG: DUF192 domain-containing protein [Opitutaceae bacterium]|nr:DUF192 domain-containing protein [Opitutaceae bacterium]